MAQTFPKSARLLKSHEYHKVRQKGVQFVGSCLIIQVLHFASQPNCRNKLGLSVPRQYGKAHIRNQFKRRMRELFRLTPLSSHLHIHIKPRTFAKEASFATLAADYRKLLKEYL